MDEQIDRCVYRYVDRVGALGTLLMQLQNSLEVTVCCVLHAKLLQASCTRTGPWMPEHSLKMHLTSAPASNANGCCWHCENMPRRQRALPGSAEPLLGSQSPSPLGPRSLHGVFTCLSGPNLMSWRWDKSGPETVAAPWIRLLRVPNLLQLHMQKA